MAAIIVAHRTIEHHRDHPRLPHLGHGEDHHHHHHNRHDENDDSPLSRRDHLLHNGEDSASSHDMAPPSLLSPTAGHSDRGSMSRSARFSGGEPSAVEAPVPSGGDDEVSKTTRSERREERRESQVVREGVQLGMYTSWIREELDKEGACMELPFTITLLVAFSFMAILHLRQDKISIVEKAIAADIEENANFAWAHNFGHKGIEDVNSYADFWSWTRLGFLPLLTSPWVYSEELGDAVPPQTGAPAYNAGALPSHIQFPGHRKAVPARNDYLRYNKIIGGVRFHQYDADKADEDRCTFPQNVGLFERWYKKPCSPATYIQLPPDLEQADAMPSIRRTEWVITEIGNSDQYLQKIVDMEDGCASASAQNRTCLCEWCARQVPMQPWLNELTRRIEINFVVFNPTIGLYSYAGVNFFFNRAGHIYKLVKVKSAWHGVLSRPVFEAMLLVLTDMTWVLMILYVIVNEGREIRNLIRKTSKAWYYTLAEDYLAFWNLIDWVSICLACTIIFLGVMQSLSTRKTNISLGKLAEHLVNGSNLDRPSVLNLVESFYRDVESMLRAEESFRFQLVMYPIILMLRLFKSFEAQPRLAIITQTFKQASSDIFHFAIVFFSVYICMVVNAVLFFGQDSEDFASFMRSFHSCFMAIYGYWDWEQMEQIGRQKASTWFWMFQIVVVLILQNITLAILMESYSEVKTSAAEQIGLFEQMAKQWRRFKQTRQRKRVRLNDIFDALKEEVVSNGADEDAMMASPEIVFPQDLIEKVQGMEQTQAERTMNDSQKAYDKEHEDPFSVALMQYDLFKLKHRVHNASLCTNWIDNKMHECDVRVSTAAAEEELDEDRESQDLARLRQAVQHAKDCLRKEVDSVRQHTRTQTGLLAHDMAGVLAEEMEQLERRQMEQVKTMEQLAASLKGVQALAYKLSDASEEVEQLARAVCDEENSELTVPEDPSNKSVAREAGPSMASVASELLLTGEISHQLSEAPTPIGVLWPGASQFAVECLEF